jgi:malate permease and related proteins
MHISILLMEQIVELFIMILMGFIIVKAGIVKDEDSKVLSKIVLYLIIPCVIIKAFQVDYTSKTVNGLLLALAASVTLQIVLLGVISVMGRLFHLNEVEIASVPSCPAFFCSAFSVLIFSILISLVCCILISFLMCLLLS